jgi:hypothetical protein
MRLILPVAAASVLLLLLTAPVGTSSTPPLPVVDSTRVAPPEPPFDVEPVLGASGKLRALIGLPAELSGDSITARLVSDLPIETPGVHRLGLVAPDGDALVAVSLEAFPDSRGTRMKTGYRIGRWPSTTLAKRNANYTPPSGFIPVTPDNETTAVSKRFRLRDFLTHDQKDVWPKALVLRPILVDKLELIGDALELRGLSGRLHVMSGFRTPQYNELGVGARGGRATNSRHMYGDAADVFVDADGNGRMDDLNGDGRVNLADAKVLLAVAEGVEGTHPETIGGLSAYPATDAHGPFVHVDARGVRARW